MQTCERICITKNNTQIAIIAKRQHSPVDNPSSSSPTLPSRAILGPPGGPTWTERWSISDMDLISENYSCRASCCANAPSSVENSSKFPTSNLTMSELQQQQPTIREIRMNGKRYTPPSGGKLSEHCVVSVSGRSSPKPQPLTPTGMASSVVHLDVQELIQLHVKMDRMVTQIAELKKTQEQYAAAQCCTVQ